MNITSIYLHKFKKFEYSKISSFEAIIHKPIQIIVGTNGSGKSSLLNELFPFPSVKSSFAKDGVKTLELEHEGSKYSLSYTTSDGHAFIKDGTNKNTNGSYNLQKELVRSYFSIDQNIQNILRCEYSLTKITPSQRKLLLNSINPVDVSYLTETTKRIHKRVVFYKNNLSMLNQRKEELLEKKMEDSVYEQMLSTKTTLEEQEKLLLVWGSKVSDLLSSIGPTSCSTDIDKLSANVVTVLRDLDGNECFTFSKTSELIAKKSQVESTLLTSIKQQENELVELVEKINSMANDIELFKNSSTSTDEDLKSVENEVASYRQNNSTILIPESDLNSIEEVVPTINDILTDISHVQLDEIYPITKITAIQDSIAELQRSILSDQATKSNLQSELQQARSMTKTYSIPENCPNNCQLKDVYLKNTASTTAQVTSLNTRLKDINTKLNRSRTQLEELTSSISVQREAWINITKLQHIWSDHPYIQKVVDINCITDMINSSPYGPVTAITQALKNSRAHVTYLTACDKLTELKKASDVRSKISAVNLDHMKKTLEAKEAIHTKLTDELRNLQRSIEANRSSLRFFKDHLSSLEELQRLSTEAEEYLEHSTAKYNREYLEHLASIIANILTRTRSKLMNVIQIVDEQKSILDRLQHEIEAPLVTIKEKLGKVVKVEKALIELQNTYSESFVGSLVKLANSFLRELMSYPLKLKKPEGKLSFKFPFIIDDHITLDDISMGSTAQKSMIDLSFNLALIIRLKLKNYPMSLDEVDSSLDPIHKRKLIELMNSLITDNIVSQLFLVNHDTAFHNALDGSYIVLNDENIEAIPNANEFVTIE